MTRITLVAALAVALSPVAAFSMPAIGDVVGTKPEDASAALEKAGCKVSEFEPEDGKIEAKCTDTATNKAMEVYIDPASGAVVDIKEGD